MPKAIKALEEESTGEVIVSPKTEDQCLRQKTNFCVAMMERLDCEGVPHSYVGPEDDSEDGGIRMIGATTLAEVRVLAVKTTAGRPEKLDVPDKRVSLLNSAVHHPAMDELADRAFSVLCRLFKERGLHLAEAIFRIGWGRTMINERQSYVIADLVGPEDLVVLRGFYRLSTDELLTLF